MTFASRITSRHLTACIAAIASITAATPLALAAQQGSYPAMAPIAQYLMASPAAEIALAKSGAPASIAEHAEVRVLGKRGYETAVKGTNGFVCVVVRSWDVNFASPDFWNPKTRAPICFNAAAASSALPVYVMRTDWVIAGVSKAAMQARDKAALAAGTIKAPAPGSMCYMLSKGGYLGDDAHGPWHPHVMFLVPHTEAAAWGANLPGSPVMGDDSGDDNTTTFFVPVAKWSDGTADTSPHP